MEAKADVRIDGDIAVVSLSGDINRAAEAALNDAYTQAAAGGARTIILNFTDTDFINSTGIAMIVAFLAHARRDERTVSGCGLTAHYEHIFEITRLADFISLYPDEPAALANAS